ncbi:MAG: transglutaminase-like domain-containing protein, partial [Terrimicrobiaceae bacterium]|nr:transglutaminase-like domain-containing protein [Terrimicrobiaceae bacterium]
MIGQIEAVARLLSDEDAETIRLVKEQLVLQGEDGLGELRELAARGDQKVSRHAREVMNRILKQEAEEDFELTCRFFCDCCDIEPALWQLALALNPGADIARCRRKVEQWGRQLAMRVGDAISSRERVIALGQFMAGELSFRGSTSDYYNPQNSLLPCVIETRSGLPITLTLLYRMVALRAGMIVDGLNVPGHFLARHEDVIFDPFHKARILARKECEAIAARQGLK